MPRVHGDTFIHVDTVDYLVAKDEPLLHYETKVPGEIAQRIGNYVARIVTDGDTIQVGYGDILSAVVGSLHGKKHLGVHTELLSDGLIRLMQNGIVDNSRKSINRGKTVAAFCMGSSDSYEFLNNNPAVEFRTINYTNDPLVIARINNMVAINTALELDLTGQATAESVGKTFFSGIGGQADFMRGALLAQGGKTILALQSTARGGTVSRIVPFLKEGAGVTLTRGDMRYVVTEYGIAYLHGKNIRERAMSLIAIAHPRFRPWLIEEAKKLSLIYKDQAYQAGSGGRYPEELETYRTTKNGLRLFLRPVKISDEPLLKEFFYSLSDKSMYKRFLTKRQDMPHDMLQDMFVVIDYSQKMVILALQEVEGKEEVVGVVQYGIDEMEHTAEWAVVVKDDYQNMGVGTEMASYLVHIAKKQGLLGFTAEVHPDNKAIGQLMEKMGFEIKKHFSAGVYLYKISF
jgi:RimJ/RimL family protein N-acetyltransferase